MSETESYIEVCIEDYIEGYIGDWLMWKEFLKNITVEWLMDNYVATVDVPPHQAILGVSYIATVGDCFFIYCDTSKYQFKIPANLSEIHGLYGENNFIDCLPVVVWKDFLRVALL